ncbi:uncharacterized protein LOC103696192 [Phoenix dactylifera]|uniref:Uncharacterized protein LOC103696192 n=1 Tax=Phoenix dactylifera TaxID=42345 RepID=A0A8B7BG21_PHODC|nr:uncharacterized protein LOC103696192 [Phoenix dactylifera]
MIAMWKPYCWKFSILCLSIVALVASAKNDGNPANEVVDCINKNRTTNKLPKLYNSPGLGCMALQYISECMGNCSTNNTLSCQPPEVDITEVYAPNCGVELPTVGTISGHLVGCQWKHLNPEQAFSKVLISDKKRLSLLHSKDHTEVGVGFSRAHHGPFFWCILFSSGKTNSTFVLEGGRGIKQRNGCFSGKDLPCSSGRKLPFPSDLKPVVFSMLLHLIVGI